MNPEFQTKFNKYKQSVSPTPPTNVLDTAEASELQQSLDSFKDEWRTPILILKWMSIGALIIMNIISFTVFTAWNGFLTSPEYNQYIIRIAK